MLRCLPEGEAVERGEGSPAVAARGVPVQGCHHLPINDELPRRSQEPRVMFGPSWACWCIAQLALSQLGFGHLCFKWPCWNWTGGLGIGMSGTNGKSRLEQHGLGLFPPPHPAFCQLEGSFGLGGRLSHAPYVPSSGSPVSLPWCRLSRVMLSDVG